MLSRVDTRLALNAEASREHRLTDGGMHMDNLRHGLNGYRIPAYMEEILTHNYCPCFMRMNIVRDGESYRFTYRPGRLTKLKAEELDTYSKLVLMKSLIIMNETAESYLIGAENYLIEPELIYTDSGSTEAGRIRMMFYPDIRKMKFDRKMMLFTERVRNGSGRDEQEMLSQLRDVFEGRDINRARILIDKNIMRTEKRALGRAS